jgi:hypothetical protein
MAGKVLTGGGSAHPGKPPFAGKRTDFTLRFEAVGAWFRRDIDSAPE